MSLENQPDNTLQLDVQKEVTLHEQAASISVAYTDESVALQIFGTTNVAQVVLEAEEKALNAVVATQ
ncbi:hypothetical protein ACFFUP_12910 [Vibrio ostreicida]|uniref:Uncharacterized protein n=1 Tax=Vibrio ostreicida TaxID=526588 RepID=A0ABT8BZL0_9VIBR|nr:hypothetical protein [Vibrio ostreicida]MDN3611515.1 hypothetical protein [Vibrio ostreicida]NPD09010.1 hypothetical protein [Vibrio ostreicida]